MIKIWPSFSRYDLRLALRGLREGAKDEEIEDIVDFVHRLPFFYDLAKTLVRRLSTISGRKVPGQKSTKGD